MYDITATLNSMTARERESFHRSLESCDHFDRVPAPVGYTIEFCNAPLTDTARRKINAALEEVEPGLRIGAPMSAHGAIRLVSAYFTPARVVELMA